MIKLLCWFTKLKKIENGKTGTAIVKLLSHCISGFGTQVPRTGPDVKRFRRYTKLHKKQPKIESHYLNNDSFTVILPNWIQKSRVTVFLPDRNTVILSTLNFANFAKLQDNTVKLDTLDK